MIVNRMKCLKRCERSTFLVVPFCVPNRSALARFFSANSLVSLLLPLLSKPNRAALFSFLFSITSVDSMPNLSALSCTIMIN